LPVADLRVRIASGRFRVKGNCDRATADLYVRDLTRLGARCSIEDASPANATKTPLPFPTVKPGATSTAPLPAGPPKPVPPPRPGTMRSGLAAAFSNAAPAGNLGAFETALDGENLSFSLASVDGQSDDGRAKGAGSFGPPPDAAKPRPAAPGAATAAKPDKPE